MRPVNLIPPEDRRGDRAPLRSGPFSYVIVGALGIVLVCVAALVMTNSTIADREAEVAQLEVDSAAAAAEAQSLAPYTQFAALKQTREATLKSLADSRFDWERVLRELALIIPSNVTLTNLTGSVSEDAGDGAVATASGEGVSGPSLMMSGCASNHRSVAGFVAALEDIDGVTRVGLDRSEKGTDDGGAVEGGGGEGGCSSANSFDVTAAFDEAPVPIDAASAPQPIAPVAPAPASQPVETNSAAEQTAEARKKAEIVPGVAKP